MNTTKLKKWIAANALRIVWGLARAAYLWAEDNRTPEAFNQPPTKQTDGRKK